MCGFQAVCLKVAKQVSLKTAFCRFRSNDYHLIILQKIWLFVKFFTVKKMSNLCLKINIWQKVA